MIGEVAVESIEVKVLILLNRGGVAGGHVVQATKTAEALRSLGVDAVLSERLDVDAREYDAVHSFGAPRGVLRIARSSGAAVVVSPIWLNAGYRILPKAGRARTLQTLERAIRLTYSALSRGFDETSRRLRKPLIEKALLFELADLLLPNSDLEAEQIRFDLDVTTPMQVVPNAIDPDIFTPPVGNNAQRSGVACVGRIEPHKNQLGLINELKGLGIPLTVVGPEHPDHLEYAEQCRRAADETVSFLPGATQEVLRDVYRSAAVHILPSWFETTGLASLEAAASGCAVVTTSRGYARAYFGEHAAYCDPARIGSIRTAVLEAFKRGPSPELRKLVVAKYTWMKAAEATLAGYHIAVQSRSDGVPPV
jgi:glycosyltransferase involved in cell wall biosynthesis